MKKSILIVLAVCFVGMLSAQNNPPATNPPPQGTRNQGNTMQNQKDMQNNQATMQNVTPPGTVSKRFNTDYPNMNSTWTMTGKNYRAEYMDANSRLGRAVIYDETGNPVGMEREIDKSGYPATIGEYYSATYPNETYRVWATEDKTGKRNYFINRSNEVIWFDDKGAYTRKSSVTPDMPK